MANALETQARYIAVLHFLVSGVNLEANVIAHEMQRPLRDPHPLHRADAAPEYTLQVMIHPNKQHEDIRSIYLLTTQGTPVIIPRALLHLSPSDSASLRLIADAHCVLPFSHAAIHTPSTLAIHILPALALFFNINMLYCRSVFNPGSSLHPRNNSLSFLQTYILVLALHLTSYAICNIPQHSSWTHFC